MAPPSAIAGRNSSQTLALARQTAAAHNPERTVAGRTASGVAIAAAAAVDRYREPAAPVGCLYHLLGEMIGIRVQVHLHRAI